MPSAVAVLCVALQVSWSPDLHGSHRVRPVFYITTVQTGPAEERSSLEHPTLSLHLQPHRSPHVVSPSQCSALSALYGTSWWENYVLNRRSPPHSEADVSQAAVPAQMQRYSSLELEQFLALTGLKAPDAAKLLTAASGDFETALQLWQTSVQEHGKDEPRSAAGEEEDLEEEEEWCELVVPEGIAPGTNLRTTTPLVCIVRDALECAISCRFEIFIGTSMECGCGCGCGCMCGCECGCGYGCGCACRCAHARGCFTIDTAHTYPKLMMHTCSSPE